MKRCLMSLIMMFISLSFPALSRADTIFLKNGFSVEGTIKSRDEEKIVLTTRDGEIEFYFSEIDSIKAAAKDIKPEQKKVTLYLKNGAVICGDLMEENKKGVMIFWHDVKTNFARNEIERIEYGGHAEDEKEFLFEVEKEEKWPYKNDAVIQLTNLGVLDMPVSKADEDNVTLKQELEEGGFIEQQVDRQKIERVLFKPVENDKSKKIEDDLRKLFPGMEHYQEGPFTIVSDSHPAWVKEYKKVIQLYTTDFYLDFFQLLEGRRLKIQNFIVIFDEWEDFAEFALSDGVPGWSVAGYFSPGDEILYMYNVLGERFAEVLFNAVIEEPGMCIDRQKERLKRMFGGEKDIVIEGMADEIKFKFERYYKNLYAYYKNMTFNTLRHELSHELLYNYDVQNVVVSKIKKGEEETRLKEKYLKEADARKKIEYLKDLFALRKAATIELEAANSWLAEGMAAYAETYPVGLENKRWLFLFQEAGRKNRILPFEQLSVYKMGSFPGVAPEAQLYAYAQSWAFVYFLMNEYRDNFMEYHRKLSSEAPEKMEDVNWFLEILGKDLRQIEKEFLAYMDKFEPLKDPEVNWVLLKHEIFEN